MLLKPPLQVEESDDAQHQAWIAIHDPCQGPCDNFEILVMGRCPTEIPEVNAFIASETSLFLRIEDAGRERNLLFIQEVRDHISLSVSVLPDPGRQIFVCYDDAVAEPQRCAQTRDTCKPKIPGGF